MSSKPPDTGNDSSSRQPLPFEPAKSRKAIEKKAEKKAALSSSKTEAPETRSSPAPRESMTIPDVVSRRMVKRMTLLCGIPTALGMSSFVASYLLVTQTALDIPNYAVLFVSLGFFGLGVLGLSYGVLSASWDEEEPGSVVGWAEFKINFGRMTQAWRSQKKS